MEFRDAAASYRVGEDVQEVPQGCEQTNVGLKAHEWGLVRLRSLSDFITKGSTPTTYGFRWESSGILFLRSECVSPHGLDLGQSMFISPAAHEMLRRSEVRDGDLLMTITGNVGRVVVLRGVGVANINQHIARIRISAPNVDPRFVYHVLSQSSCRRRFESITTGQAYPQMSLRQVREAEVPLPNPLEQRAIAEALSDADGLLGALEVLIVKKRAIKQAAMQQLLTGKTRLPGFSGEWETCALGDVAAKDVPFSFVGGPFGSNLKSAAYVASGVRIIQLQNIGDGVFHDDYSIFTSEEKADELKACNIYPGEIILSKMGDPVARACLVPPGRARYLMASDGIRLSVDRKRFSTAFALYYINHSAFRSEAIAASSGSTRLRIALSALKCLPFRAPALEEQTAIATVLSDMDAEIGALEARREKTRAIKQGMMQQLLTGRVRLVASLGQGSVSSRTVE